MKIKYISCDGETEVDEEISKAEFYRGRDLKNYMYCERSHQSPYYEEDGDNGFEVNCDSVVYIKA